jgi:hypothetical protein
VSDTNITHEAQQFLDMSEDDLFILLGESTGDSNLYSKDGLLVRGKNIFGEIFQRYRNQICPVYQGQKASVENGVDLVVVIMQTISSSTVAGVPILPVIAIAIKLGLDRLCQES